MAVSCSICCHGNSSNRYLVVLTPGPGSGSLEAEEEEGVLTADDQQDGEELQIRDQVTHTPVGGGKEGERVRWNLPGQTD